jgi:hypothetical protein
MQNKPKSRKAEMNVNKVLTRDYENMPLCIRRENKPNQTQNKPNQTQFQKAHLLSPGDS